MNEQNNKPTNKIRNAYYELKAIFRKFGLEVDISISTDIWENGEILIDNDLTLYHDEESWWVADIITFPATRWEPPVTDVKNEVEVDRKNRALKIVVIRLTKKWLNRVLQMWGEEEMIRNMEREKLVKQEES